MGVAVKYNNSMGTAISEAENSEVLLLALVAVAKSVSPAASPPMVGVRNQFPAPSAVVCPKNTSEPILKTSMMSLGSDVPQTLSASKKAPSIVGAGLPSLPSFAVPRLRLMGLPPLSYIKFLRMELKSEELLKISIPSPLLKAMILPSPAPMPPTSVLSATIKVPPKSIPSPTLPRWQS